MFVGSVGHWQHADVVLLPAGGFHRGCYVHHKDCSNALAAVNRCGIDPIGGRTLGARAYVSPASNVSVRALRKQRIHARRNGR
jgi:hypothetical protein